MLPPCHRLNLHKLIIFSRQHSQSIFLLQQKSGLTYMWTVCLADNSHETTSLICTEDIHNTKLIVFRALYQVATFCYQQFYQVANWIFRQQICYLLLLISNPGQSDFFIKVVDINSHTWWQTVQIQISWLLDTSVAFYTVCLGRDN